MEGYKWIIDSATGCTAERGLLGWTGCEWKMTLQKRWKMELRYGEWIGFFFLSICNLHKLCMFIVQEWESGK